MAAVPQSTTSGGRALGDLPHEIKVHVARMVYLLGQPTSGTRTLHVLLPQVEGSSDPLESGASSALEEASMARHSLWTLALVSHAWHASTRPFLFRAVHIGLPHSFILLLRSLGASFLVSAYDAVGEPHTVNADPTDPASFPRMVAAAGFAQATGHRMVVSLPTKKKPPRTLPFTSSTRVTMPTPDDPPPMEATTSYPDGGAGLLTSQVLPAPRSLPPFPVRGKLLPDNDGELELVWEEDELLSEVGESATEYEATETESEIEAAPNGRRPRNKAQRYVVSLRQDDNLRQVHRYVRVLDFSTFRTQGLRRTVGDGEVARFVTPARLLALITSVRDSLTIFGASENMDSALTLPVLESLLFRPTASSSSDRPKRLPSWAYNSLYTTPSKRNDPSDEEPRTSSRGRTFQRRTASLRGVSLEAMKVPQSNALEVRADLQDANPPVQRKQLKALDFCGCVSIVFQAGLQQFVERHLTRPPDRLDRTKGEQRGRSRTRERSDAATEESGNESDHRARYASQPAPRLLRSSTIDNGSLDDNAPYRPFTRATSAYDRSRSSSSSRRYGSRARTQGTRPEWKPATFPYVKRLGLSGARTHTQSLETFVLAFPHLTHLDLSRTMVTDTLLAALGSSTTLRLRNLGLAGCVQLSSTGITDFLLSPVCNDLTELSLRRKTDAPALTRGDAEQLLRKAHCIRLGQMRYLDLGGCGIDDLLLNLVPAQPWLLDLGLANCPLLSLPALADWILFRGRAVEVLDLSYTGDEAEHGPLTATKLYTMLLSPLAEPPHPSLAEQLAALGGYGIMAPREAATNLQVVGLSPASLHTVGGGISTWRAIRGAGRRGWIVDTSAKIIVNPELERSWMHNSSAPIPRKPSISGDESERERSDTDDLPEPESIPQSRVLRGLPADHPRVRALRALADNQFNVASVGWHSHKSDILHGLGFLGRESGSYAHVAYARS